MSWYRLAPVATIQSTNPALINGTTTAAPSPAGVNAPAKLMPTVTFGRVIFSVNRRQASCSRPPL